MAGTPDLTEETPIRRMAVARATFDDAIDIDEAAAAAVALAAIRAPSPRLAFSLTHCDVIADATSLTCTVQGFAREDISHAALLGAAAAAVHAGSQARFSVDLVQSLP